MRPGDIMFGVAMILLIARVIICGIRGEDGAAFFYVCLVIGLTASYLVVAY